MYLLQMYVYYESSRAFDLIAIYYSNVFCNLQNIKFTLQSFQDYLILNTYCIKSFEPCVSYGNIENVQY